MLKAGLAAGLAAIVAVPALAQAPLKLGVLNELSGPFGPSGTPQRDGFLLYLKEHGQKLGGRPVETVIEDTAGDPATGLNKAKKLAEADKIDILVGPLSSAVGAAIKSYVVSQKLPTFLCSTVDEVGDGKYIFRLSFTGNADSFLQGYLAGKAGFKRAVIVAPDYIAGQTAAEWFDKGFKAAGGTVVQKLLPRVGLPDYGGTISSFDSSADVLIVFMAGGDALRFVKQYADYGKKLPMYGFTSTVDDTILPAEGKAALGFVGAGFYFSTIDTPENKAFVAAYNTAYHTDPAWFSVCGYDTAMAIDAALTATHGDSADRDALIAAAERAQLKTPAGPLHFDKAHNPVQPRYIMQIREVGGKIEPVVLGKIDEFQPVTEPPALPPGLVLPK